MPEKLTRDAARRRLLALPGWELAFNEIKKTYVFGDFAEALVFVNRVGELAEEADHHPDILIKFNRVTLELSTHSAGGITELDFSLAGLIDTRGKPAVR